MRLMPASPNTSEVSFSVISDSVWIAWLVSTHIWNKVEELVKVSPVAKAMEHCRFKDDVGLRLRRGLGLCGWTRLLENIQGQEQPQMEQPQMQRARIHCGKTCSDADPLFWFPLPLKLKICLGSYH